MGLKETISGVFKLGELKDQVLNLFEAKFELKKIEIQEKAEKAIADLLFKLVLALLSVIIICLFSVWAALALNSALGYSWGFVIIIGFYLLLLLLIYLTKDKIALRIREKVEDSIKL